MRSFARTWLNKLKGRNIRVNVLSPGPIATPMQNQVLTEEAKQTFESLIQRGKMGRPEEIALAGFGSRWAVSEAPERITSFDLERVAARNLMLFAPTRKEMKYGPGRALQISSLVVTGC